jgi:DNA-directed RNA polymerase subunit RPC12/RpoP
MRLSRSIRDREPALGRERPCRRVVSAGDRQNRAPSIHGATAPEERPAVAWRGLTAVPAKRLVECTGCDAKLRVDAFKSGTVACPRCGARVEVVA